MPKTAIPHPANEIPSNASTKINFANIKLPTAIVANFIANPARTADPGHEASTCASGSHNENGNDGVLISATITISVKPTIFPPIGLSVQPISTTTIPVAIKLNPIIASSEKTLRNERPSKVSEEIIPTVETSNTRSHTARFAECSRSKTKSATLKNVSIPIMFELTINITINNGMDNNGKNKHNHVIAFDVRIPTVCNVC